MFSTTWETVIRIRQCNFNNLNILLLSTCIGLFFSYVITVIAHVSKHRIIKYGIYTLAFSIIAIDYFLIANFQTNIGAEAIKLLIETNSNEALEFLSIYLWSYESLKAYCKLIAIILIFYTLHYSYKHTKHNSLQHIHTMCSTLATLIICSGLYYCVHLSFLWKLSTTEQMMSFTEAYHLKDPVSRIIVACKTLHISSQEVNKSIENNHKIGPTSSNAPSSMNIVIVIGESFNKWHSPIYGYTLNTTPHMLQEHKAGRLIAFDDVVAPSCQTSLALKNIFSCNSISNGEHWFDFPLFSCIFKKAGWNVYMWDNQRTYMKGTMFTFALNSFLYDTNLMKIAYNDVNKENFKYDEELIESFDKKITTGNNLVIFHLLGQHAQASCRYPHKKQFEHFTADSIKRKDSYLNDNKKTIIAQYDNATLYNDYVISLIYKKFSNSNSVIVYLSDHGDEIYDFRDHYCRDLSEKLNAGIIKHLFKIPFFVWLSPQFMEQNPQMYKALQKASSQPFESDNICHMLFNIGNISTHAYIATRDVLNHNYKPAIRHYVYMGSARCPIE